MDSKKTMKNTFRLWITMTSVAGFLGGWAILAHAPKPAPLLSIPAASVQESTGSDLAPLPTLALVPSLDNLSQLQALPSAPQIIQRQMPRFRTRGS